MIRRFALLLVLTSGFYVMNGALGRGVLSQEICDVAHAQICDNECKSEFCEDQYGMCATKCWENYFWSSGISDTFVDFFCGVTLNCIGHGDEMDEAQKEAMKQTRDHCVQKCAEDQERCEAAPPPEPGWWRQWLNACSTGECRLI